MYVMGKRGPKPGTVSKVRISQEWTPELAYAIGLLASDGCLSSSGHLIDLTSKDREQLKNFCRCLGIAPKIGTKSSGYGEEGSLRVQFKSVLFYTFLESIGLTPRKSKTLKKLGIPPELFWDFLRGVYDGDGSSYSYWDPRWRSSFMFYTSFVSASREFIDWIQSEIKKQAGPSGKIGNLRPPSSMYQLRYAKADSLVVLRKMYYSDSVICLSRKRLKIEKFLATVGEQL